MGVGNSQSSDKIFLNLKKGNTPPHFTVKCSWKPKDEYEPDEKEVSGWIKSLGVKENEWEGKTIKSVILTLHDEVDLVIGANLNSSLGRALVNAIVNIEEPKWIRLALYVNKKGYSSLYVEKADANGINAEGAGWKRDYEKELKPLVKQYEDSSGELLNNYKEVNLLLLNDWEIHAAKVAEVWKANQLEWSGEQSDINKAANDNSSRNDALAKAQEQSSEKAKEAEGLSEGDIANWLGSETEDDLPF